MASVGMISLGCEKNRVDAEIMMARLQKAGYTLVDDASCADVAIVNTCGFIEAAKKESIGEILELGRLKKAGCIKALVVTGCMAPAGDPEGIAGSRRGVRHWSGRRYSGSGRPYSARGASGTLSG